MTPFLLFVIGLVAASASPQRRSGFDLLGLLSSATDGTKLGTAFKVIDTFSKVEHLISDLKNVCPDTVQQELNASISTVRDAITDVVGMVASSSRKRGFDLLGVLSTATGGTKLGTALKIIDAFSKVEHFLDDIKTQCPQAYQDLDASISSIKTTMSDVISKIGKTVDSSTSVTTIKAP